MEDNIVNFQKKKTELENKQIKNKMQEAIDMLIENCFDKNGMLLGVDAVVQCIAGIEDISGTNEELNRIMISTFIAEIENRGYWREAQQIRELVKNRLDKRTEFIERVYREKERMKELGKYSDEWWKSYFKEEYIKEFGKPTKNSRALYRSSNDLIDELTAEERKRIETNVNKIFNDEIDFSGMSIQEKFCYLVDLAKYAYFNGEELMNELAIDEEEKSIGISFRNMLEMEQNEKTAIAALMMLAPSVTPVYHERNDSVEIAIRMESIFD